MRNFFGWTSVCFAGGLFGGLVNSLFLWMAGAYGWTAAMGVAIAPAWTLPWLYPRLVWGGIWGLLFLPRFMPDSLFWRGLILSLGPTLVQLLIVFPTQLDKGLWGQDLGAMTPVLVLVANAVWGWAAALWVLLAADEGNGSARRLR
ncbi:hypothetical protein DFW101_1349 [Solidesulfovibrio carbinoliphilus subsp. oakridgensis]|uniref:Uncharacterized protein n=1 Tax=Solidesulfovibrio carbinoliphilus subsp. oakridgensis TaxID=694327 RepID=G7Q7P9_9BACT|nr:hypothetical protein [Solidesulfovibrio carbinoliphilus]EHJ47358.1 hypothetical protein DFW101_1349 [Solidesulfovibrio carbinoliphilus subsp. oakridgensis]